MASVYRWGRVRLKEENEHLRLYVKEHVNLVKVLKIYAEGYREPRKVLNQGKLEHILEGAG